MPEDDSIVADFIVESREHLTDIENQLLAIEAAGADIDVDLVNTVFRAIHSIKGVAGFLGFSVLGELAHSLENVLNLIRNRELIPDSTNVDIMLRAADAISGMIENVQQSNEEDISVHVKELQQIASGSSTSPGAEDHPPVEVSSTNTHSDNSKESDESVEVKATNSTHSDAIEPKPTPAPKAPVAAVTSKPVQVKSESTDGSASSASVDSNIRVSVKLLDNLMNLAGELVLSRNQLVQNVISTRTAVLESVASRIDQVTSELQEAIMQTRMQVVGTVFAKFPRVVRDLSRQLNKQCELTVEGKDVELDKSIIEAIGDPLTHLVRNSVDHGIESSVDRASAGKPANGTVILRAYHQAGKVNISISDDGAGIDVARLKEKALERGLITPEQAFEMGDREAQKLIFHPGFSMAKKVTDVSGRGVGMDVVKTNIEKLGGAVSVESELGRGTTINIKLPLTLAIVPSLIVRCSDRCFAIPQTNICELVRVQRQEVAKRIECIKDAEIFRLRGKLLPLVRLNDALGVESVGESVGQSPVNIIVVEAGHFQYGLIVDGLHDSEEIVVKPLGRHMQESHTLAGATILGDGEVALILDVAGIAAHSDLAVPEDDELVDHDDLAIGENKEVQTSLLFTNHPEEQFGIPMEAISRLERVRGDQIDSIGGMEVLQYRGASLPLLTLERHIKAEPRDDTSKVYIVVFSVFQREVGLIVPHLVDIRQISTEVDTTTFREPGVIGSVEVDRQATRLLDPHELTKLAHPEWFESTSRLSAQASVGTDMSQSAQMPSHSQKSPIKPHILLAEDSGFFRMQVMRFMEDAGYKVVGCEDGQIAWNTLQERGAEFDLVVTDIEMPNMDGCQLAQHIKADPNFSHLPIIAVTSLASEEDMQHGMESGIDDYQVKLDRERLMASLSTYVQKIKTSVGLAGERSPLTSRSPE